MFQGPGDTYDPSFLTFDAINRKVGGAKEQPMAILEALAEFTGTSPDVSRAGSSSPWWRPITHVDLIAADAANDDSDRLWPGRAAHRISASRAI
jgi:hypothetical protein